MTPREKILAIGVGVAIVFVGGNYAWSSVSKGLQMKQNRVEKLGKDIADRTTMITNGLLDRNKLQAVTSTSLPSDVEQARAAYNEWLIGLREKSALTSSVQNFNGLAVEKDVGKRLKFQINGRGTIENLTKLLYEYYEKNYLHRITLLRIDPVLREPNQLDITLVSEVLALENASPTQAEPEGISYRVKKTLAEYSNEIAGRNLFSPTNHPPKFSATATQEAIVGSPFTYDPGATDPDAGQYWQYEIIGDAPEGFKFGKGTEAYWTPRKTGSYVVNFRVTDTGIPSKSADQTLTINVVDPPPIVEPKKEVKMDIALQAEVSALVSGRDGPEAWVRSKLEGKTLNLKVGDKLTLGSVEGIVLAIGANYMELETDGKKWTVGLDESLADAYQRMKTN